MIPRKANAGVPDIFEPDVSIRGKLPDDDSQVMTWFAKQEAIATNMGSYWRHYLDRGKAVFDSARGVIFDDDTRSRYENIEDKIPVEPLKIEPPINRLVGELIRRRRSGMVVSEGGSIESPSGSAEELEVVNAIMKDAEHRWGEDRLVRDALQHALMASYPVWIWFERTCPYDYQKYTKIRPTVLPWDSVVVAPFSFKESDGSDITSVLTTSCMSDADLVHAFPDAKPQIKEWVKRYRDPDSVEKRLASWDNVDEWDGKISSSQRTSLYNIVTSGRNEALGPDGFHFVRRRCHRIELDQEVAVDLMNPNNVVVRPGTWEDDRWTAFIEDSEEREGTTYEVAVRPQRMLWLSAWSTSGIPLANELHWFQKQGRMPGVPFIPSLLDGEPVGPGARMLKAVLEYATMRTEFLDDIRKASGTITIGREGAISNIDDLPSEMNRSDGFVSVREDSGPLDDSLKIVERKPNSMMLDYSQVVQGDLEESTAINKEMLGGSDGGRKSGVYQQTQIGQGLLAQSMYVANFNDFWEALQTMKLCMLPYAYDEATVLEVLDEENDEMMTVEVNQPQYDVSGNQVSVINDLSTGEYRYKIASVDDSPTAKEWEFTTFTVFLNSVPGPVMQHDPSGKLLAKLMMAMPNRFAKDAGRAMAKDVEIRAESMSKAEEQKAMLEAQTAMRKLEIESEKARKYGVNLSLTGEQIAEMPELAAFLQKIGFITPQQEQMQQQQIPQQAPTPQGV